MIEIWKDIIGYEGMYQVSNLGNFKSLDREVYNNGTKIIKNGQILKPFINGSGYMQCRLHKDGKREQPFLHKIVAELFIPNVDNLDEVNHIDHNKLNNSVQNLEWCTRSENMIKYHEFHETYDNVNINYCNCGNKMYKDSLLCLDCYNISQRRVERPSKDELLLLIKTKSFLEIGRMFNVSDNAIRKWCKIYNLPFRKKDIT